MAVTSALEDIRLSLTSWRLWTFVGWQDIRARYRGSVLGPIWIAGGLLVVTLGAGVLFADILKSRVDFFIPYLCVGLTMWTLISATVIEGAWGFLTAGLLIKNSALPLFMQILRVVWRNLIVLAHNLVVVVLVLAFFRFPVGPSAIFAIPGFVLVVLNLIWIAYLCAIVATRYRDFIQIITYIIQFVLFVTPIFWQADAVSKKGQVLLAFNPIYQMIEVVRGPIMGHVPGPGVWLSATGMAVVGLAATLFCHLRYRATIVYWL